MRQIETKLFSHESFKTGELYDVNHIASSEPLKIKTYYEVVERIAQLSFYNKDYLLFYRGQNIDHKNRKGNSSFYPSIYRTKNNETLKQDVLNYRFNILENLCIKLIDEFDENQIQSINELRKRKYIQWSILQHYEVCDTPLIDLTQSIRVACSFAFMNNSSRTGYVFVFGLPYITNRISRNSEHDLVNIRLINICPPEAMRPYFQEGYLVGTDDVTPNYEDRTEFDLKRRLIAKFEITDNKTFWGDEDSIEKLLMPKNDKVGDLCNSVKIYKIGLLSPKMHFQGVWINEYEFSDGRKGQERVEIKDTYKYYSNGRHKFNIDLVEFNKKNHTFRFRKNGVGNDKTKIINDLKIINEKHYEGYEHRDTKVTYKRIE